MSIWNERAEDIAKEFRIEINSTEPLQIPELRSTSKVFLVKGKFLPGLHVIDTEGGKRIACHPHIIGKQLAKLSLSAALEATKAMEYLLNLRRDGVVLEHVLRASPGYNLHTAFRQAGINFYEVFIRPKYEIKSYRRHRIRKLNIIYRSFESMPRNERITLVKPDTEATGKSAKVSIGEAIKEAEKRGSRIERVILYGFISRPALDSLKRLADRSSFELVAFSIGNVTGLAHNWYDMPAYGMDESYYRATGKIKRLGCITDFQILKEYLPFYVPGCDQPGDWSARQEQLFTGHGYERVNSREHLANSIRLIDALKEISCSEKWQKEIAERELSKLGRMLRLRKNIPFHT